MLLVLQGQCVATDRLCRRVSWPASRGGSSVGRAPGLQPGGRGFESLPLHAPRIHSAHVTRPMDASVVYQYRYVLAFLAIGLVFAVVAVALPYAIAPRGKGADAEKTYESGIIPERGAWKQFSLAYYLYALLYLAVAVDVIYLFPVALVFRTIGSWQV